MNQIPSNKDKITALQKYLEANRNDDEGDSWIFGHNPTIIHFIESFDKSECERLCNDIWDWHQKDIHNLADIFLENSNPHIDGNFMYGKIFLQTHDIEDCEYLIENMQVLNDNVLSRPLDFYEQVRNKIGLISNQINRNFDYWIDQIDLKKERIIYGERIIIIKSPEIRMIKSNPTTLGNYDISMVIFDANIEGINEFISNNEQLISDKLFENCSYENVHLIHTTTPMRGEPIKPLTNTDFTKNRTNCESITTFHCLSTKNVNDRIVIKSAFYFIQNNQFDKLPSNYSEMSLENDMSIKIITDKKLFHEKYQEQVTQLKK